MNTLTSEVEHYRQVLRFLAYYLEAQSTNDVFILELMKGDDLEDIETAVRGFVEMSNRYLI